MGASAIPAHQVPNGDGYYVSPKSLLSHLISEAPSELNQEEEGDGEQPLGTCEMCGISFWPEREIGGFLNTFIFSADSNQILKEPSLLAVLRTFPSTSTHPKLQSPQEIYSLLRCWGSDKKEHLPRILPLLEEIEDARQNGLFLGDRTVYCNCKFHFIFSAQAPTHNPLQFKFTTCSI